MRRIIITGKRGYMANSIRQWIQSRAGDIEITMLDLRGADWENESFENVDAVIHTAALVHKSEKEHSLEEYRKVNTQLTMALAEKAKREGVWLFIYISSMAVYGCKPSCFKAIEVTADTPLEPKTKYGVSKLEAEEGLRSLEDGSFKAAIFRPPLVYGKGCPGNYGTLRKLTLKFGLIPKLDKKKSMIYIDNLCEAIYQVLDKKLSGVFTPQNRELKSTYQLAELIAENNGRKTLCTAALSPIVYLASPFVDKINTAFGSLFYSPELSRIPGVDYNVVDFEASVRSTEAE